MSPLRLRAQWWHKIDLSECRPRYYACISRLLLFSYSLTLKKKVTLYVDALTHRWQLWAPLWIGALLWRHMFLGTTTCYLGCAHTTLGAASISFGRPSAPHQQPPGISRSSLWGMISTRSVPFTAVTLFLHSVWNAVWRWAISQFRFRFLKLIFLLLLFFFFQLFILNLVLFHFISETACFSLPLIVQK